MAATIQEALTAALQRHQAGQLAEAEAVYRQVLAQHPRHPDALHLLGVVCGQSGRIDLAIDFIGRAIAVNPSSAAYYNSFGKFLMDAGQSERAVAAYRQALRLQPNMAEAHTNLGIALRDAGQVKEAIAEHREALRLKPDFPNALNNLAIALKTDGQLPQAIAALSEALRLQPDFAEAHGNLGATLTEAERLDEAIAACNTAIKLRPQSVDFHNNLGDTLMRRGRCDQAIAMHRRALQIKPGHPETYNGLGSALKGDGQLDQAIAAYRQALAIRPNYAEAHNNLANVFKEQGRLEEAIASYREALRCRPDYAVACSNLGVVLADAGQFDEAITFCRRAIELKANFPEAYNNLGSALMTTGRHDEAIVALEQALQLKPAYADALNNLGVALKDQGRLDEALACFSRVIEIVPDNPAFHSNRIYVLHFHPDYDAAAILREQALWNSRHLQPFKHLIPKHDNSRDPDRPLRIGYVSPDWRDHVIGRNLLPLLREHDRRNFELFCYSDVLRPDAITEQFRLHAGAWRNVVGLTTEQLTDVVRGDRIDILVDLALHMAHNRLPVFARKPAPVQITFAGYPGGTGLETMDYRLTDPYLDPPGNEAHYVEQSIRLPDSFWCYDESAMTAGLAAPPVAGPLPAIANGYITFGCLNNFCKVNDRVLELWARVLTAVAGARLTLLAPLGRERQRILDRLASHDVPADRVEFVGYCPRGQYLSHYQRIDMGLDTFPYNGHTTSLDSLWMGVPVVTLSGKMAVGRAGWSQLCNLNLRELAVDTPEKFVSIATDWAGDLPRLGELRCTLRERMRRSPLMDAKGFTGNIEAAYRQVWRKWCGQTE